MRAGLTHSGAVNSVLSERRAPLPLPLPFHNRLLSLDLRFSHGFPMVLYCRHCFLQWCESILNVCSRQIFRFLTVFLFNRPPLLDLCVLAKFPFCLLLFSCDFAISLIGFGRLPSSDLWFLMILHCFSDILAMFLIALWWPPGLHFSNIPYSMKCFPRFPR